MSLYAPPLYLTPMGLLAVMLQPSPRMSVPLGPVCLLSFQSKFFGLLKVPLGFY